MTIIYIIGIGGNKWVVNCMLLLNSMRSDVMHWSRPSTLATRQRAQNSRAWGRRVKDMCYGSVTIAFSSSYWMWMLRLKIYWCVCACVCVCVCVCACVCVHWCSKRTPSLWPSLRCSRVCISHSHQSYLMMSHDALQVDLWDSFLSSGPSTRVAALLCSSTNHMQCRDCTHI